MVAGSETRESPRSFHSLAAVLLLLSVAACTLPGTAEAHGFMSTPLSRQRANPGEYCEQCANGRPAGKPSYVCGNTGSSTDYDLSGPIKETYQQGQAFTVTTEITAYHKGHVELYLCDSADSLSQSCFDRPETRINLLNPQDTNWPNRLYLEPLNVGGYAGKYTATFALHVDVTCTHCVLQWKYVTSNSCLPAGYRDAASQLGLDTAVSDCCSLSALALGEDCDYDYNGGGAPERFWNCADIAITDGGDGGVPPPIANSPSPSPSPASEPSPAPELSSSPSPSPTSTPPPTPRPSSGGSDDNNDSDECWTTGSWWPETTCKPTACIPGSESANGWVVNNGYSFTSEANCCKSGAIFFNGCSATTGGKNKRRRLLQTAADGDEPFFVPLLLDRTTGDENSGQQLLSYSIVQPGQNLCDLSTGAWPAVYCYNNVIQGISEAFGCRKDDWVGTGTGWNSDACYSGDACAGANLVSCEEMTMDQYGNVVYLMMSG